MPRAGCVGENAGLPIDNDGSIFKNRVSAGEGLDGDAAELDVPPPQPQPRVAAHCEHDAHVPLGFCSAILHNDAHTVRDGDSNDGACRERRV